MKPWRRDFCSSGVRELERGGSEGQRGAGGQGLEAGPHPNSPGTPWHPCAPKSPEACRGAQLPMAVLWAVCAGGGEGAEEKKTPFLPSCGSSTICPIRRKGASITVTLTEEAWGRAGVAVCPGWAPRICREERGGGGRGGLRVCSVRPDGQPTPPLLACDGHVTRT